MLEKFTLQLVAPIVQLPQAVALLLGQLVPYIEDQLEIEVPYGQVAVPMAFSFAVVLLLVFCENGKMER
jgi:hypothetical protein